MATAVDDNRVRVRVTPEVQQALTRRIKNGGSINAVIEELLQGHPLIDEAVSLEQEFCKLLASTGDRSEVMQLQEIAKFRGASVMQTVIGHVRWGLREGQMFES